MYILLLKLSEMSDMVDSIAEDKEWIETVSPMVSPQKLERSLSTSLSPRRLDLKSPMEEKSPVKIPPKEEDMDLSSSSSSEDSEEEEEKIKPPVIKLQTPPRKRVRFILHEIVEPVTCIILSCMIVLSFFLNDFVFCAGHLFELNNTCFSKKSLVFYAGCDNIYFNQTIHAFAKNSSH